MWPEDLRWPGRTWTRSDPWETDCRQGHRDDRGGEIWRCTCPHVNVSEGVLNASRRQGVNSQCAGTSSVEGLTSSRCRLGRQIRRNAARLAFGWVGSRCAGQNRTAEEGDGFVGSLVVVDRVAASVWEIARVDDGQRRRGRKEAIKREESDGALASQPIRVESQYSEYAKDGHSQPPASTGNGGKKSRKR